MIHWTWTLRTRMPLAPRFEVQHDMENRSLGPSCKGQMTANSDIVTLESISSMRKMSCLWSTFPPTVHMGLPTADHLGWLTISCHRTASPRSCLRPRFRSKDPVARPAVSTRSIPTMWSRRSRCSRVRGFGGFGWAMVAGLRAVGLASK